jgi:anti-sigma factor RsiW
MNEIIQPGPCADYEHDIVELVDGSLATERGRALRRHLDACPRCRAWLAGFASLDARLESALPHPSLGTDFAARLHARLEAETRPVQRADLLAAEDSAYRRAVEALRSGARRSALLDAIAAGGGALCAVMLARSLAPYVGSLAPALGETWRITALGVLGSALALGALAWSASRGALPVLRLQG